MGMLIRLSIQDGHGDDDGEHRFGPDCESGCCGLPRHRTASEARALFAALRVATRAARVVSEILRAAGISEDDARAVPCVTKDATPRPMVAVVTSVGLTAKAAGAASGATSTGLTGRPDGAADDVEDWRRLAESGGSRPP